MGRDLKAFYRMDDAWVGSIDIAIKKAKTAVFFGMPTGAIGKLSQPGGSLYGIEHSNEGLITFPGGLPIVDEEGVLVGAIGVSGSAVENDNAVAQAGVAVLGVSELAGASLAHLMSPSYLFPSKLLFTLFLTCAALSPTLVRDWVLRAGVCVGVVERFEGEYLRLRRRRVPAVRRWPSRRAGLALGAGIVLAPMRRDGAGAQAFDLSGEDRILAALTGLHGAGRRRHSRQAAARLRPLGARRKKPRADRSGAAAPAAHRRDAGVPLHLADRLMAEGFSPRELCKQLGFELPAGLKKYSPDQPRDERGRWTVDGDFRLGLVGRRAGSTLRFTGRSSRRRGERG